MVIECTIPPVPAFRDGTPRDRILAAIAIVTEADMGVIAYRTGLPMETVYTELAVLMTRHAIRERLDKRGYPQYRRNL